MASSFSASQPLLGDQYADVENQLASRHDHNSSSSSSSSSNNKNKKTTSIFTSASFGGSFIGSLSSWSKRGARELGLRRSGNSSHRRQHETVQRYYNEYADGDVSVLSNLRAKTRSFLSSKWGHYLVLFMVSVDVACIFADFLIELRVCELRERHHAIDRRWGLAQEALGLVGLIFSCLFMLELIASVLSFGLGYFRSKFHTFDALVIVLAFIMDVALRGVVEELGSLVVVLRLWRVFKIIEEIGDVSAEMMEKYEDELEILKLENSKLKRRLKGYGANDDEDDLDANAGGDEEDINE